MSLLDLSFRRKPLQTSLAAHLARARIVAPWRWLGVTAALVLTVISAVWLGLYLSVWGEAPLQWRSGLGLPALVLAAAVLWLVQQIHSLVQRAHAPWKALVRQARRRAPDDLSPIALGGVKEPEVQAWLYSLNHLLARMQASNEAQQRFIADAAHQLRTPLAALQAQVEAWALTASSAPDQMLHVPAQQVEQLRSASRRTTQLANQLLVLSRVDSGLSEAAVAQRVNVQSLCEAVLESFLESAWSKRIDLGLESQPAHVTGHEWLLRELISNVLDNAVKYTPEGGKVTLRCGRKVHLGGLERAFVELEDDGPGVPVGEYVRLTDRFYRGPNAGVDGTGLGLAIAQEIAQVHGAQLHFASGANDRGMRVSLVFGE